MVLVASVAFVGCGKKGVDTGSLEKNFASAEAPAKAGVEKAVSSIKAGDYAGALTELKKVADKAKLTPEQQQAINDVIAQVNQMIAEQMKAAGDKATKDLNKAAEGIKNPLAK